jgi:hypothetical protein
VGALTTDVTGAGGYIASRRRTIERPDLSGDYNHFFYLNFDKSEKSFVKRRKYKNLYHEKRNKKNEHDMLGRRA